MHLSFLSDSYLSDSLNDAGAPSSPRQDAPSHFAALCRGLIAVAALSLPVGLTLFAQATAADAARQAAQDDRVVGVRHGGQTPNSR